MVKYWPFDFNLAQIAGQILQEAAWNCTCDKSHSVSFHSTKIPTSSSNLAWPLLGLEHHSSRLCLLVHAPKALPAETECAVHFT